ncbi:hypothetical protein FHG87_020391 [Trinorchestia longiramus]|nr:hypothetical protein FHG87_020391 [Trinorchestia longiramus]
MNKYCPASNTRFSKLPSVVLCHDAPEDDVCFSRVSSDSALLGRLVSESAFEREDPGSNPAADMVDAARNTAWDLGKHPNNYRSNYPTQEWARRNRAGKIKMLERDSCTEWSKRSSPSVPVPATQLESGHRRLAHHQHACGDPSHAMDCQTLNAKNSYEPNEMYFSNSCCIKTPEKLITSSHDQFGSAVWVNMMGCSSPELFKKKRPHHPKSASFSQLDDRNQKRINAKLKHFVYEFEKEERVSSNHTMDSLIFTVLNTFDYDKFFEKSRRFAYETFKENVEPETNVKLCNLSCQSFFYSLAQKHDFRGPWLYTSGRETSPTYQLELPTLRRFRSHEGRLEIRNKTEPTSNHKYSFLARQRASPNQQKETLSDQLGELFSVYGNKSSILEESFSVFEEISIQVKNSLSNQETNSSSIREEDSSSNQENESQSTDECELLKVFEKEPLSEDENGHSLQQHRELRGRADKPLKLWQELKTASSAALGCGVETHLPPAEPQFSPAEPQFSPAEPQFSPAEPQFSPAEPQFSPAEPQFRHGARQAYVQHVGYPLSQPPSRALMGESPGINLLDIQDSHFSITQPNKQAQQPVQPTMSRFQPVEQQFQPVEQQFQPVRHQFQPMQHQFQPVRQQFQPVRQQFQPVRQQFQPVRQQFQPVRQQFQPVRQQFQPVRQQFQPVRQQFQPTQKQVVFRQSHLPTPYRHVGPETEVCGTPPPSRAAAPQQAPTRFPFPPQRPLSHEHEFFGFNTKPLEFNRIFSVLSTQTHESYVTDVTRQRSRSTQEYALHQDVVGSYSREHSRRTMSPQEYLVNQGIEARDGSGLARRSMSVNEYSEPKEPKQNELPLESSDHRNVFQNSHRGLLQTNHLQERVNQQDINLFPCGEQNIFRSCKKYAQPNACTPMSSNDVFFYEETNSEHKKNKKASLPGTVQFLASQLNDVLPSKDAEEDKRDCQFVSPVSAECKFGAVGSELRRFKLKSLSPYSKVAPKFQTNSISYPPILELKSCLPKNQQTFENAYATEITNSAESGDSITLLESNAPSMYSKAVKARSQVFLTVTALGKSLSSETFPPIPPPRVSTPKFKDSICDLPSPKSKGRNNSAETPLDIAKADSVASSFGPVVKRNFLSFPNMNDSFISKEIIDTKTECLGTNVPCISYSAFESEMGATSFSEWINVEISYPCPIKKMLRNQLAVWPAQHCTAAGRTLHRCRQDAAPLQAVTKCKGSEDQSLKKCKVSQRKKEWKLSKKVDSMKRSSDIKLGRPNARRVKSQDSTPFRGLITYPHIDSRWKGYQNIGYSSEISHRCDDQSCSNTSTEKFKFQTTKSNECHSTLTRNNVRERGTANTHKIVYYNSPEFNLPQGDKCDKSKFHVMKRAFNNVCKLPVSLEAPKDFVCRTSYRRSSDSTQVTTLSSSCSQIADFDSPVSPISAGACGEDMTQPRLVLISEKAETSSNAVPATSTMKEELSLSSMPPLALEFTAHHEQSFEKIFGINRKNSFQCSFLQEQEMLHELLQPNIREECQYENSNNITMARNTCSQELVQTEKTYHEVSLSNEVKDHYYYNLIESRNQKLKLCSISGGSLYENLFPTFDYLRHNQQLSACYSASQTVVQQTKSTECRFEPGMIFSVLETILEKVDIVQINLQSLLSHFIHPSSEILAVQEGKMLIIRRYVADLLRVFNQFQELLAKAPQRLSNMRYLLLPCNNSLNELCEYLRSMKYDLIDSQCYFNESITRTLLKLYSVAIVLTSVVSRGQRSFIRSVLKSTNLRYPVQVYDLNDRSQQYLQPFVELLVRRVQVLEQLRKLIRRVSNDWESVTTWQEFLPSLCTLIGTIRTSTPHLSLEADEDFWSLAKILPHTKLPSVFDNFLSEFYRAMVVPSFAENNPHGFVSLLHSLQYIIDNVIQQHAVILEGLKALFHD